LFESDKKTEIIDFLSEAYEKNKKKSMNVNVADKFTYAPKGQNQVLVSFLVDDSNDGTFLENQNNGLIVHVAHDEPDVVLEVAFVHIKDQPKPIEVKSTPVEIKLRKRWKYKLEIRFYVNVHLEGCEFIETIETVTKCETYKSKVGILEKRDERYVFTLPERQVLYSMLSKTRVKAKLTHANGSTLLAVRYVYDVK
jgi:myosin I